MSNRDDGVVNERRRLKAVARETGFPVDALLFVRRGYFGVGQQNQMGDHIDAQEWCWRLRDLAIHQFGSKASKQLGRWSICDCEDFGRIVFALVDAGLLEKTAEDSIDDFKDVFDFAEVFPRESRRIQWQLSTLFIVTTFGAIAIAAFARHGVPGVAAIVMVSWIGVIAIICIHRGIAKPSFITCLIACIGVFVLVSAIVVFFGILGRPPPP